MATFSLADMSAAFPTIYREIVTQTQRKASTLRLLKTRQLVTGTNAFWDVRFKGQSSGAVNSDGGNFLSPAADVRVNANLGSLASYSAPISVTDKLQWAAANLSAAGQYNLFEDAVQQELREAVQTAVKAMNVDLFTGGGGNAFVSLATAISASGVYANIDPATYSQWASYNDTSGSNRSLSLAMIKSAATQVSLNSAMGRPTHCVLGPALFNTLESLFDSNTAGATGVTMFDVGNIEKNRGMVRTSGGMVEASGFRNLYWINQNLQFVEDPDCPANLMYMFDIDALEVQYLLPPDRTPYLLDASKIRAEEQKLGPIANLEFQIKPRGRTGFADQWDILTMAALVVKERNACAVIDHVQ